MKKMIHAILLVCCTGYAADSKQFIREVFSKVFENMNGEDEVIEKYFSPDYVQLVDGKTLNYAGFVKHLGVLKQNLRSLRVTFRELVAEGDRVATVHLVEGVKKNGSKIRAQVNAIFQIRDGKLIRCDELTHILEGDREDRDMGSRER